MQDICKKLRIFACNNSSHCTMNMNDYTNDAVALLCQLIATPSVSRDEKQAADVLCKALDGYGLTWQREGNNVWTTTDIRPDRPTLLLNAHIDTVKPVASWTRDPFCPTLEGDRLYGLGANDCGGGLVSLLQVFRILTDTAHSSRPTTHNLIYLASAEEEVSGKDGIVRALPLLPPIDLAIVGEPTGMQPAVAEKGLMVVDGYSHGVSGHAARDEGVNAIYEALDDLCFLRQYRFPKVSKLLGPTKMQVTQVESGTQHNVVPDLLHFVIDIRTNELYTNEEVLHFLQQHCHSELKARSTRLHSSHIALDHWLVERCVALGMQPFGSPTLSDQALMPFTSIKLGPGQSSRSHSADEFICRSEISHAIETYCQLLS